MSCRKYETSLLCFSDIVGQKLYTEHSGRVLSRTQKDNVEKKFRGSVERRGEAEAENFLNLYIENNWKPLKNLWEDAFFDF